MQFHALRVRVAAIFLLIVSAAAWPRLSGTVSSQESIVVIRGAIVVDGTGARAARKDVLIRGDRIVAVDANLETPAGARVIDADGKTLIPGLFDLHTHLPYSSVGGLVGDWPKNLLAYLYCGVTSVVDFGTYPETFGPMRQLTDTGAVLSPRLSLAARFTTPGGHGAEGGRSDIFTLEVSTPEQARAAVRRLLHYRPDVIKVFTDGWRYGAAPDMSSMNEETLTAIVAEAHNNGIEVLTHTVTLARAKIAARAGVDVIAHGIGDADADDELIELIKSKGTAYVSTLAVYEPRGRDTPTSLLTTVLDPSARARLDRQAAGSRSGSIPASRQRRWKFLQNNIASLRRAGVHLAVGTDAGVTGTHHGWATLRELKLLVSAGMTPIEAITSATGVSAKAIGVNDERGTIAPGKLADLVIVDGAPHRDIEDIDRIERVILGGKEINRGQLAASIADPAFQPIRPIPAPLLLDDFQRADGRSQVNSLWINGAESGHDNSRIIFGRVLRAPRDFALSALARMAERERSYTTINLPLSPGAVIPVDASSFRGVRFDARGDGEYRLTVQTLAVRDGAWHQAAFRVQPFWQTVTVPFAALRQRPDGQSIPWTGHDLLMLSFEISRPAGETGWLELDNVRFYR